MMIGQQAQVRPVVSTTQAVGGTPLLMYGRDTPHNLPSSLELSTIQVKDLQLARRIASLEAQIAPSFSADRFRGDMPVAYLNQLRDHHIPSVDFSRVVLREPSPYLLLSSRQEFIERPISFPPASKVKSGLDLLRDASVVATAFTTTRKGNEDLLAGQSQSDSRRQHFMGVFSVSDQIPVPDDAQDTASDGKMYIDTIQEWDVLCGRGGRSNRHPGNKFYRQVVAKMKMMYRRTEAKASKTDLSRAIVVYVYGYGGRFVKKDEETGSYYVLSQGEARKKTSQALRETKELKWTL